ncbi:hypothetical protein ACFP2D_10175 [Corynebacterium gerontici]
MITGSTSAELTTVGVARVLDVLGTVLLVDEAVEIPAVALGFELLHAGSSFHTPTPTPAANKAPAPNAPITVRVVCFMVVPLFV